MKMLYFILFFTFTVSSYAKNILTGTIINKTGMPIIVEKDNSTCWYDNNGTFKDNIALSADEKKSFTTEDNASGNCYDDGAAFGSAFNHTHTLKLKVTDIFGGVSSFTLSTFMYPAWNDQCQNVSKGMGVSATRSGCYYTITINPLTKMASIGLGKYYLQPIGNTKVKVTFTSTLTACYAEINANKTLKNLYCDHTNVASFLKDNKLVFMCQQGQKGDSRCPWVTKKSDSVSSPVKFIYSLF
ncbi:hypothetical protein L3V83_08195 [Thiotrichales bacterium 19X7-9]|nr:hypothetical protein [Thiotrichales bacterium 19X7-9]